MNTAFAQLLEDRFRWTKHHLIATVRADGSPRISGTEVHIIDGVWWLGSMSDSRKSADIRNDPRVSLHTAPQPVDEQLSKGDAKIRATAVDRTDSPDVDAFVAAMTKLGSPPPPGPFDLFRLEILEASIVKVDGDQLEITIWNSASPEQVRTIRRS